MEKWPGARRKNRRVLSEMELHTSGGRGLSMAEKLNKKMTKQQLLSFSQGV